MSGTIVALGGLSPDHDDGALHRFIVDAAKTRKPRICFVPIASGDLKIYISLFYEQYPSSICVPSHLELLRNVPKDPAEVVAAQDIVYLGGGSTPVLVAAMRIHGLDRVLRAVWARGGVLCGHSAGAHAWFSGCITDSLGPDLRVFADGLGIVDGTCVAHFDQNRAEILASGLETGELAGPAWGIEEGAALVLTDSGAEALSTRDHGGVHRITVEHGHPKTDPVNVRRI